MTGGKTSQIKLLTVQLFCRIKGKSVVDLLSAAYICCDLSDTVVIVASRVKRVDLHG